LPISSWGHGARPFSAALPLEASYRRDLPFALYRLPPRAPTRETLSYSSYATRRDAPFVRP
jgi:hypothetical protein